MERHRRFFSLCLFQGQNFGSNKRGAALVLGEEGERQGERYWVGKKTNLQATLFSGL